MGKLFRQIEDLRNLFGRRTLMIPCKGKVPAIKWGELTIKAMSDPDHLTILSHYNIAIVNGKESDGLCCIDVDEESFTEVLLEKNPFLRNTTKTKGKRGMHFWFRLMDNCPPLTPLKYNGLDVGEFRSTGGITVIAGEHPDGGFYRIENRVRPIEISYDKLWLPTSSEIKLTDDTERTDEDRRGVDSVGVCEKLLSEESVIRLALPHSPQNNQLTSVKGLENLTQLKMLYLTGNKLTDVKGLEKLDQLETLSLEHNQLTSVKGLEKLTKLEYVHLWNNQLTDVTGLEKLTQLTYLHLARNPALTKAQIAELQKALPKCDIYSTPTK